MWLWNNRSITNVQTSKGRWVLFWERACHYSDDCQTESTTWQLADRRLFMRLALTNLLLQNSGSWCENWTLLLWNYYLLWVQFHSSLSIMCSQSFSLCCDCRPLTCRLSSGAFRKRALMRAMAYVWISWFDLKFCPASQQTVRSIMLHRPPHTVQNTG